MRRPRSPHLTPDASTGGFTLVEMVTVITIILILSGLVIGTAGYIQKKGATSRAEAEIAAISAALESYKADNGIYPISTDVTASKTVASTATNAGAAILYRELAGDTNGDGTADAGVKTYMEFKPAMLNTNTTRRLIDPYGNNYVYLSGNSTTANTNNTATFDLWSTGGRSSVVGSEETRYWIKNW